MKIGIYARGLSGKGGVKKYIEGLTKAMIDILPKDDELFIIHNIPSPFFLKKKNVHEVIMNSSSKVICDYLIAPSKIRKLGLDAVLFTKDVIPFFTGKAKKVVTVHDLAYFLPEYNAYKFGDTLYMKSMIKSSCKRADAIISVSENTKQDLQNILKVPSGKINVVYEAADNIYHRVSQKGINSARKKYLLPSGFILYAGSISPRKNLKRAIYAFSRIKQQIDEDFVITGNKVWNSREVAKLISKEPRIKVCGFVKEEDMPALYSSASLCIYPSLYEGFGLPILEAQACGCPVLASDASSLPEVAGDGAILFNPRDENEMSALIKKALHDKKIRRRIIKNGYTNIKRFSWEKAAKQTLKIMKEKNG